MTRPAGAAKLPGLPVVNTGNASLDRWIQAVSERLEVREGARGNPHERAVTVRELRESGLFGAGFGAARGDAGSVLVVGADGAYSTMTPDAFADGIRKSKLYKDMMLRLDDVTRFDGLPDRVKEVLLRDLAAEAAKRGADIQRLEYKLQSATDSLAYRVEEITASVAGSVAGVREMAFASATESNATAGVITQLVASLDGTGSASAEESLVVIADRTAGLSSQYMLKLNAGNAVAGIGLMASEDPDGLTESSFLVQADKFAVVMPGLDSIVPFGVDASGVYINGSLRINGGGSTLAESAGKYTDYIFRRSATAPATPTGDTPSGWSDTPPTGTDPLYMSKATKTAGGALIGSWSTPVRLDGPAGFGIAGQYTESQYAKNTSATSAPTSGFSSTQPSLGEGEFMWMQIRTVTPPAAAGGWGAAVRISGEKGNPGAASTVAGPQGKRGTVVTRISGGWNEASANAQVASVVTSAGGTPTTPIKGDIVSYTGGAMEYNGSSWGSVAAYIDGSLIVTGTIGVDRLSAGTITAAVSINSTGFIKSDGSYTSSGYTSASHFNTGSAAPYGVVSYSGAGGAGVVGYSTLANTNGVQGGTEATGGVGVLAYRNSGTGVALKVQGPATVDAAITSTLAAGQPLAVTSKDVCTNLNAEYLNGFKWGTNVTGSGSNATYTLMSGTPGGLAFTAFRWFPITDAITGLVVAYLPLFIK